MHEKLNGLTCKLFEVECEYENLKARLARVEAERNSIQDSIFFIRPLYEHEAIEFENLVLVLNPRGANAMTKDQYEKLLTKDIAV